MELVIGRIGRAHGIHGDVAVEVRTDDPDYRFAIGASIATDPPERGPLIVRRARWHSGRLLLGFEQVADRTGAEALRGTLLVADSATAAPIEDPEEYWDHELVGLSVVTVAGETLGEVAEMLHPPGNDLLAVRRPGGEELLIPFVAAMVPEVDVAGHRIVVAPPPGLLDDQTAEG